MQKKIQVSELCETKTIDNGDFIRCYYKDFIKKVIFGKAAVEAELDDYIVLRKKNGFDYKITVADFIKSISF